MKRISVALAIGLSILLSASSDAKESDSWDTAAIKNAKRQISRQIDVIEKSESDKILNPVTLEKNRKDVRYCRYSDWRSGFFPGTVWYLYELTGDSSLLPLAEKYTEAITPAQHLTHTHDLGFIIYCCFGNGLRLANHPEYEDVIVTAANSLCTRFHPGAGIIQSWNVNPGSSRERKGWICPVIIDNMMNLELLFEAAKISGDSTYYNIAVSHADKTLKEHFRPNSSCYHVIDYDPKTGFVRHRQTAQGYADESSWARGQAWAIYGFTTCYRYTHDERYLQQAMRTFEFMRNNPNMPKDHIPYWDMDAPKIPNEPRDASSAAVIASALYEMSEYCPDHQKDYMEYAESILKSLSSDKYTAKIGKNGNFVLMHSVTSFPSGSDVDMPLNYADYYYLEALKRKRDIEKNNALTMR